MCKKYSYKNYSLWICLVFILGLPSLTSCADPRLASFIEDYKNMPDKESSSKLYEWTISPSPFYSYLDRDFVEGLTLDQVKQYQRAQKLQRCETIKDLEQQGFLNLYPFLRPAFERTDIPGIEKDRLVFIFNHNIVRVKSPALQFCRGQKELEESKQAARRLRLSFPPIRTLDLPKGEEREAWYLEREKENEISKRCYAIRRFISLALTEEYRPAVMAVLRLIEKPNTLTLSADMEHSLRKLAKRPDMRQSSLSVKEKNDLDRPDIIKYWWEDKKLDCVPSYLD